MTDELDKYDLSAWEAPEPPANLADAVLARMGSTDIAPAMPEQQPRRRRAWMIAGVAAACLAVTAGAYALIRGGTRHLGPSSGSVVADRAQTLTLGDAVRAELDPGAQVSWRRDGGVLRVDQRAGAAAWRVSGDEKVWIDAGATVASVEASGASLRVEVKMNQADTRLIGATALTAMVVSVVTVVVYEGHVKVSGSHGQPTVIVQPGSTYNVTPPGPPALPEPPTVGASQPLPPSDPSAPSLGDLRIWGGERATIHAAVLPVLVEIELASDNCTLVYGSQLVAGTLLSLGAGPHEYSVECPGGTLRGTLVVVHDKANRPLPKEPAVNPLAADGRTYRVSYQSRIPDIEVSGKGRLHVVREADKIERTYDADLIPGTHLVDGEYTYWRAGEDRLTKLIIDFDQTAPQLELSDVTWDPHPTLQGRALPGWTLSVNRIEAPLAPDGRFAITTAVADVVVLRADHPQRGNHYYVLRSPRAVTVATASSKLDRASIMKVMSGARSRVAACASKAAAHGTGRVVVKTTIAPDGSVSAAAATSSFDSAISDCIVEVVRTLKFPASKSGITFSFPFLVTAEPACDPRKLADKGRANLDMGQHAAALAQFEAALKCTPNDSTLLQLAFMSACNSKNESKANVYFNQLPPKDATKLEQICIRNGVSVTTKNGPKPPCDADVDKEKGMEAINMGEHALALKRFEASLACKDDPYLRQLAFMEACASGNAPKAQLYYKKLTPAQQNKFAMICVRQKPPVQYLPSTTATRATRMAGPDDGFLEVFSKPEAKILIDGVDTGLTTPITGTELPLSPGKHKVTFVVDDDRFTYPVIIRTGETERMSKDLQ